MKGNTILLTISLLIRNIGISPVKSLFVVVDLEIIEVENHNIKNHFINLFYWIFLYLNFSLNKIETIKTENYSYVNFFIFGVMSKD